MASEVQVVLIYKAYSRVFRKNTFCRKVIAIVVRQTVLYQIQSELGAQLSIFLQKSRIKWTFSDHTIDRTHTDPIK